MVVAGPTLIEAYAVLTRLPAPHRIRPKDALALIEGNFVTGEVVALDASSYRNLVRRAAEAAIAGGRAYDAVIAECARVAAVDALCTFNIRHFKDVADAEIQVIIPEGLD